MSKISARPHEQFGQSRRVRNSSTDSSRWFQIKSFYKLLDGFDGFIEAVEVRRMATVCKQPFVDRPARVPLDRVDLRKCAIGIVPALDQQHRGVTGFDAGFDIPGAEVGLEPDFAPGIKHGLRMIMIACKSFGQPVRYRRHAATILSTVRSSTNTCGAISTSPFTGWPPPA